MRRGSVVVVVFAMIMSILAISPVGAVTQPDTATADLTFTQVEAERVVENRFKEQGNGVWVIHLSDAPVATYDGSTNGLNATSPEATGDAKLDADSPEARAYRDYLVGKQADFVVRLESTLDRSVNLRYQYTDAANAIALSMTWQEASRVARLPEVADVQKDTKRSLATDSGPSWIGAGSIWDGSATGLATQGEGIIVGVLDSGINPSNPSFADVGGDGYDHTNPWGAGNYAGICDAGSAQYDPAFACNDKLIGAWNFTGDGTIFDDDGHGSHTASTAAGNVTTATLTAPTLSTDVEIAGVAPHANIISYDVCEGEGCDGTAILAGIDQAILDGVDVINYSIGSPAPADPWASPDDIGFLNARAAGIFVAHSAGNEGPDAATVGSPMAPWMTHVAALTHNRVYVNSLTDMAGGVTAPPGNIDGVGFTSGYGPERIIYAGALPDDIKQSAVDRGIYASLGDIPDNNLCGLGSLGDFNSPWLPDTFQGEIVVCDRGTFGRVEKGTNVLAAGAGGYVLADNGGGLSGDAHDLPGVHITQADGGVLKTWLTDGGTDHTATISGATRDINDAYADQVAGFSSRGPNRSAEFIAPSVGAPGVDIIAAAGTANATTWDFLSGTSMSSPHIAGAAALLTALHPDWTPPMIESAMMTTAVRSVVQEDGATQATPFDTGAGRVDLVAAANAAIVLDEIPQNYADADPSAGGDPTTLNLASMAESACVIECSWTRTFTSTASSSVTWNLSTTTSGGMTLSVSPTSITLAPGESAAVTVTANVEAAPSDVYHFGSLELSPSASVPAAHLPIAVQPTTGSIPELVNIETSRDAGSWTVDGLEAIEIEDFTVDVLGLTKANLRDSFLPEDPTNGDAFDDLSQVFLYTFEAGEDTHKVIAEITASEAPDLDLFLGYDVNGDGLPNPDTELACVSASATALESCSFDGIPGTWWVVVQNWAGSGAAEDWFTLATAAVSSNDEGNMSVDGPASVPQLEPFSVSVLWDLDDADEGDRYYGAFSLGTSPSKPGNIGVVDVTLDRVGDDVAKSADVATARPGDTITYTVTVQPNVFNQNVTYTITDELPDGVTYVEGSATGGATHDGGTIQWSAELESPYLAEFFYEVSTPATNAACDTGFGGYVDLESLAGFTTDPGISGDTTVFTAFTTANPVHFYGDYYPGVSFTDDGFLIFDTGNYGGAPWISQDLPDAAAPNNLITMLWNDFEIVYDAATNSGITLATAGPDLRIIEWDNVQFFGGSPDVLDMQAIIHSAPSPDRPEIVMAYRDVDPAMISAALGAGFPFSLGVENAAGDRGLSVAFGDPTPVIGDGTSDALLCYDYVGTEFEPISFEYQVTVDDDATHGTLTNTAVSELDLPGSAADGVSATVDIFNLGFIDGEPRDVIDTAASELAALLAAVEDSDSRNDVYRLMRAQTYVSRALGEWQWVDDDTLTRWGGGVYWKLQQAHKWINRMSPSASFADDAGAVTVSLTRAAGDLTRSAIEDSLAKPWLVRRAELFADRADALAADGQLGRAISMYKYSWGLATTVAKNKWS